MDTDDFNDSSDFPDVGRETDLESARPSIAAAPSGGSVASGNSGNSHGSTSTTPSTTAVQINSPLQGLNVGFQSAAVLASTMDDMQREKGVRLLNFSYIKLNTAQMLGEGSFSRVYRGRYKRRECAIKMIFTFDLTADEIKRVAAESQILSSLRHPNIIEILGVAVLPPSVCILLELCKYGSLSDVLRKRKAGRSRELNVTYLDILWLALGCCRGLTALHASGPEVCHRDIKSYNFLGKWLGACTVVAVCVVCWCSITLMLLGVPTDPAAATTATFALAASLHPLLWYTCRIQWTAS